MKVEINVAGVQKNLAEMVDKLSGIFQRIIANPAGFMEAMKIPMAAKAFSKMIEYSGLSSPDFNIPAMPPAQLAQPQQVQQQMSASVTT